MPAPRPLYRHWIAALGATLLPFALPAAVPLAPNPSGGGKAAHRCPTFEWRGDGAAAVALEVYRVADDRGKALDGPVLQHTVAGPASRWSAAGGSCLQAGTHAWSVRSLPDGAWSDPMLFEVGGVPSDEELAAAVAVIEQYLAQRGDRDTDPSAKPPLNDKGAGAITAVQGLVPDAAGTTRGVHGVVASPAGVGVLAENSHPAGFDLQLAGPVPALVNEREWRLDSATPQSVNFTNPSGAMSVQVQGQTLITAATDQNTTYSAGNQLALVGTTFNVVEGPGSGLDADTVDGLQASAFAPSAHDHFGQTWSGTGTLGLSVQSTSANFSTVSIQGVSAGGIGLRGISNSDAGTGVVGSSTPSSGTARGVLGASNSAGGVGGMFANLGGGALLAATNASSLSVATAPFVVDNLGDVRARSFRGDGRPLTGIEPSMFRTFGGDGSNGALVVSNTISLSGRRQYTSLTINQGGSLRVTPNLDGRILIGVQGRCTIRGAINAIGSGAPGGTTPGTSTFPGQPGRNALYEVNRAALPNCVSGAGGGGGPGLTANGGNGGGAQGDGGTSGFDAGVSSLWKRQALAGGGTGNRGGNTGHSSFADVLACPGAGGGSGAITDDDGLNSGSFPGGGGDGGGVIYLECGELEFPSGVINANGTTGGTGQCIGVDCSIRDNVGGGGGGGGGVVLIRTRAIISQAGDIQVFGGNGGPGAGFASAPGARGAPGYVDVVVVE